MVFHLLEISEFPAPGVQNQEGYGHSGTASLWPPAAPAIISMMNHSNTLKSLPVVNVTHKQHTLEVMWLTMVYHWVTNILTYNL